MDAKEALVFALDWPKYPFLPCICNSCGQPVVKRHALAHMNGRHPGWLEMWNAALAKEGL
jgi:hypothetical protein